MTIPLSARCSIRRWRGRDMRRARPGMPQRLWRWVSQGEGDVVITDVVMPDENAFDLIPRIKKVRPDLPIIVMSAQNTLMTALTAAEKGAYEYLPKPFDLSEVVAVVSRALAGQGRRPRATAPRWKARSCRSSAARPPCRRSIARSPASRRPISPS